jgi:cytochrome c556
MNDDFLYRLRTEPPPHFAAALKARLDRAPSRRMRGWQVGLGVLLFGTAFAMVSPAARQSLVEVIDWIRGAPQAANVVDVRDDGEPSNQGLARAFGDRPVERPGEDVPANEDADAARDLADATSALLEEQRRRSLPAGLPALPPPVAQASVDGSGGDGQAGTHPGTDSLSGESQDSSGFIVTGPLLSEPGTVARAFENRRALFTVMSMTLKPINDSLLRGRKLSNGEAELAVRRLETLAAMIPDAFALDERGSNVQTRSLPYVWEQPGLFAARTSALMQAAHALRTDAQANNRMALMRGMARVAVACNACHIDFRKGGESNLGAEFP